MNVLLCDRGKGQTQPRDASCSKKVAGSHLCTFLSQVTKKPSLGGQVWADGSIYAVGDCNYGCIGEPGNWEMPPVPKISYPGHWVDEWEGMAVSSLVKSISSRWNGSHFVVYIYNYIYI